ncbi:hypothetical protein ACS0TY_031402 [Phlomoides rotata]
MAMSKVNVDGGATGAPDLGDFTIRLGSKYAFEAELTTTLHAIFIASDKGWNQIWMECDSIEDNATTDRLTRESVNGAKWWNIAPNFLRVYLGRDPHSDFYHFTNL